MKNWILIGLAVFAPVPALFSLFLLPSIIGDPKYHLDKAQPLVAGLVFGIAVLGAAFLLTWACEVAQLDIPAALALSVLALIAVLPEYAVDFTLTFQAATDPAYKELAVANMIGANRMIVGFAWPLIIFLFWLRFRKREVTLEKSQRVEVGFLGLAGLYSLVIPLKGHIDFFDVAVLVTLFVVYTVRISRSAVEEPHLIGPAEMLATFPRKQRLTIVGALLLYAATVIFIVAHPFAESLINTGKNLGVDEVFMIQWFAPLASEAPEIVVCVLFTLRGMASAGLGALVASKVNQWTLLVGTLPLVFVLGKLVNNRPIGEGSETWIVPGINLSGEQIGAMFVTSGQTLLAVAIMLNLTAHLWEAGLLFFLLIAQFFFPNETNPASPNVHTANFGFFRVDSHWVFGAIYMVLFIILAFRLRHEIAPIIRAMFDFRKHPEEHVVTAEDEARAHALDQGVPASQLKETETTKKGGYSAH